MRISGTPAKRFSLLFAVLFLVTGFVQPAVLAQGEPGPEATVSVAAFNCGYDPGIVSAIAGTIPLDCTPTAGTWFSIWTDDGAVHSGCTTDGAGICGVTVPDGATVTVQEDVSLMAGTAAPRQNPISAPGVTGIVEFTFINLPVAQPLPTAVPTEIPTEVPTAVPTDVPTEVPTEIPTVAPTEIPTEVPTVAPTEIPTQVPTLVPTEIPTVAPTPVPTEVPPVAPLVVPTVAPTKAPTQAPTPTPTKVPTQVPTPTPTKTPAPVTTRYGTVSSTGGLGLRCRTAPVSGAVITVLAEGTRLEARGAVSNGWLPVRCAGQNGWVSVTYITLSTTSTPSPTPAPSPTGSATVSGTGGLSLRCRTAPNASATIITLLPDGSRVETRGAATNGWVPVRCGGQNGWVSAAYVTVSSSPTAPRPTPTPTTPPVSGTPGYGTVSGTGGGGLNCRTTAISGSVITILREGTRVETRGAVSNGWVPVRCASQNGWVSAAYLTLSSSPSTPRPTPTPTPAPPSGSSGYAMVSGTGGGGVNCRTTAVSGSVITILPEGTRVEVFGSPKSGWAQVRCAGQIGWVSASYLLFNVGSGSGSGEVWIDVNLSTQYMTVYQGSKIIGQTYVSTGRYGFDTPPGTFYVNYKLSSQTMTGVLGGEYYYVQDVPWVMYFTDRGHAIHGAYWHNNFGYRMSHGCVNLPVGFAQWLYGISPVGTRVNIHY